MTKRASVQVQALLGAVTMACSGCLWGELPARVNPAWTVTRASSDLGCAIVDIQIAKSGKTGIGVVIGVRARDAGCVIQLERVAVHLADGTMASAEIALPEATLGTGSTVTAYVPLPFDNTRAWNEGARSGLLTVHAGSGGEHQSAEFPITHAAGARHE